MELRRIFNRRVKMFFLLMLLCNALFFVMEQTKGTGLEETLNNARKYNLLAGSLKELGLGEALEELSRIDNAEGEVQVVRHLLENKLAYLIRYSESIEGIFENAQRISRFSIFSDADSYSYKNIIKTAKDFEKVRGLKLWLDNDRAFEHFISYPYLYYFVFLFIMYVLYELVSEKNNRIADVTHAMYGGRCILAVKRCLCLTVLCAGAVTAGYIMTYVLSVGIYGMDNWGSYVQSVSVYEKYPYPLTIGAYLGIQLVRGVLSELTMAMLAFGMFTLVSNRNLAVGVLLAIFGGEWWLAGNIGASDKYKLFRYVNLSGMFDMTLYDKEYMNVMLFGRVFSDKSLVVVLGIMIIAVSFLVIMLVYGLRYPHQKGFRLGRLSEKIDRVRDFCQSRMSVGAAEWYKVLRRKGLLLCAGVVALGGYMIVRSVIEFPSMQQEMDVLYEENGGADWTDFYAAVESMRQEAEETLAKAQELEQGMISGELDSSCYFQILELSNRYNIISRMLTEYDDKIGGHESLSQERNIHTYVLSDRGYNELFGENSYLREAFLYLLLLIAAVMLSANVFFYEREIGMEKLFRISERGSGWIWKRKMMAVGLIILFLMVLVYGIDIGVQFKQYRLRYLGAPVQSVSFLAECPLRLSLCMYTIISYGTRVISIFAASAAALMMSADRKKNNRLYIPVIMAIFSTGYLVSFLAGIMAEIIVCVIFGILSVLFLGKSYRRWNQAE